MTSLASSFASQPRSRAAIIVLSLGVALFWALRIAYWVSNDEEPFSDLIAYETMGRNVAASFDFSGDGGGFWQSYWPPGTGALRGLVIWVFGVDSQLEWRFFIGGLTFLTLLWMAREVTLLVDRLWPSVLLVLVVSVSRSSVFWSFKVCTEPVTEMLVYAVCAAALASRRKRTAGWALVLGIVSACALLTRGNYAALAPILLLVAALDRKVSRGFHVRWRPALAFGLGIVLLWGPWMVRSYRLYGAVVPLVTAAPFTFLLEVPEFTVTGPDGVPAQMSQVEFIQTAQRAFPDDYQAMRHAWSVAGEWLVGNPGAYAKAIVHRINGTFGSTWVALTHLPRDRLFAPAIDFVLIERSPLLLLGGLIGFLVAAQRVSRRALILVAIAGVPWLVSVLFIGVPRMLDPSVPLIIWGNLGWLGVAVPAARRRLHRGSVAKSTGSGR